MRSGGQCNLILHFKYAIVLNRIIWCYGKIKGFFCDEEVDQFVLNDERSICFIFTLNNSGKFENCFSVSIYVYIFV